MYLCIIPDNKFLQPIIAITTFRIQCFLKVVLETVALCDTKHGIWPQLIQLCVLNNKINFIYVPFHILGMLLPI